MVYTKCIDSEKLLFWTILDSGSSINVVKDIQMLDSTRLKTVRPISVQTSGQGYDRINQLGEDKLFDKVYYDKECFINIWSEYDVRGSAEFKCEDVYDANKKKLGPMYTSKDTM